jgi:hypothetical protein
MQKYAKLPVSFQCNERDSVTNFIYHSESYNAIYVNFVSIENSQIRVCSAGVSNTDGIGFVLIALAPAVNLPPVSTAPAANRQKNLLPILMSPTVDSDNNFRLLHLKLNTYNNKSIYKCKL